MRCIAHQPVLWRLFTVKPFVYLPYVGKHLLACLRCKRAFHQSSSGCCGWGLLNCFFSCGVKGTGPSLTVAVMAWPA